MQASTGAVRMHFPGSLEPHASVLLHRSDGDSESQGYAESGFLWPGVFPRCLQYPAASLAPYLHGSQLLKFIMSNLESFLLPPHFTSPLQTAFHLGSLLLLVFCQRPDYPNRKPGEPLHMPSPLPPVPDLSLSSIVPTF